MGGEVGWIDSLPLLPAGTPLFELLPVGAIVLNALAPAIDDGVVTVVAGDRTGMLVIRAGAISDAVSFDGARVVGAAALQSMTGWDGALVSASQLDEQAMAILGPLMSGQRCYDDLRLEWTRWSELLDDLRARGGTYVVELRTPAGCGVTVVRGGQQVATYTDAHPALGPPELIDALTAAGAGSMRVTVGSETSTAVIAVTVLGSSQAVTVALPDGASGAEAATHQSGSGHPDVVKGTVSRVRPQRAARPDTAMWTDATTLSPEASVNSVGEDVVAQPHLADDQYAGNATLTALFGDALGSGPLTPLVVLDKLQPPTRSSVGSLLPELKLLVQQRLQRSAGPVQDIVDAAADGGESVVWLADRVRVMTVRGFMTSTFEQLADDIVALSRD